MKKYKNNNEAAKSYADLLYRELNDNQQKLQHEAACLDFAAGANWKDEQLRLSNVSGSLLIPISTLRDWIDRLDMMEYDLNHRIYVKDDIEKLVTDAEKQ
jgi:hypothetical protein